MSNVPEAGIGNDPSQSAQNQASHGMSKLVDGSGPIFSMYLEMAEEEDKKTAELWQANADGILIFTGLFSAAVASLISVSIQDIQQNPQDTSNFYLANIYRTIVDPNISSSLPSSPPPFSPPNSAVWVNTLWFLSLVTSITCALLATLLRQWAQRYLRVTQPRYCPQKRARIRTFFAEGVEKFVLLWVAESLPTLLHASLFLFFAGLAVFLCTVNLTIFKLSMVWIGFCTALYGGITFTPIFYHDSPYYTPFTILFWQIVIGILDIVYQVRWSFGSPRLHRRVALRRLRDHYHKLNMQGMHKTAEGTALDAPSEIDSRAFMWTFDSLDEDHELERFFSGLPGFRRSRVVIDPLPGLKYEQKQKISEALRWLSDVTLSSDLLEGPVKKRRAIICAKAVDPAHIPDAFNVLNRILSHYQYRGPLATEIVEIVRGWGNNTDEDAILDAQATMSMIVVRVQPRDHSWFMLASKALGAPESVLRNYDSNGDSLSLAILIHITRHQFSHHGKLSWPSNEFSEILKAASKFNVQGTSPELRHEFCTLWNQIVLKVQNDNDPSMAFKILGPIRNLYTALHQNTDSAPTRFSSSTGDKDNILREPSSYPLCNVAGHIHDDLASTATVHTALHYDAALVPASSVPAQLRVDESLTDVPPLDHEVYCPGSFHPAHQTPIENLRICVPFPDPISAPVIQGHIGANTVTPLSIQEPSAPALSMVSSPIPIASTFAPVAVAVQVQHVVGRHTFSPDVQGVPSLPFPAPVLNSVLHTEPHSSLLVPAAPGPSRTWLSSAPDLDVAADGRGSAKAALHKERDPPTAIREKMTAPDLPQQLPSPLSVTDVTIAGPSLRSPGVEHTASHGQYDIITP